MQFCLFKTITSSVVSTFGLNIREFSSFFIINYVNVFLLKKCWPKGDKKMTFFKSVFTFCGIKTLLKYFWWRYHRSVIDKLNCTIQFWHKVKFPWSQELVSTVWFISVLSSFIREQVAQTRIPFSCQTCFYKAN